MNIRISRKLAAGAFALGIAAILGTGGARGAPPADLLDGYARQSGATPQPAANPQ